jgi:predicted dehydrogenase
VLRDLRALGAAVHVVARSEGSVAAAREGGAASVVARAEDLPPVAGALVASASSSHAAVVEALLPRGVPLFVEKPLTMDAASADRIAAAGAGRLFLMEKWRYHPGVEALRGLARSGALGPVLGLRTTRVQWGGRHADMDCIWTLLPHDLSIFQEVVGPLPPVAFAAAETAEGAATGLDLRLEGEGPWLQAAVSARSPVHRRVVALHGRDGVAVLEDAYAKAVTVWRPRPGGGYGDPLREDLPLRGEMPLLAEVGAFLRFLEGGPPPRGSAAEGAAAVRRISEARALAGLRD